MNAIKPQNIVRPNAEPERLPQKDALARTKAALEENQTQIDSVITTVTSGQVSGALLELLNGKANELQAERNQLQAEQRRLTEALIPLRQNFDAINFRQMLNRFGQLAKSAQPEELQQLLRLLVYRIVWMPDGRHRVHYYDLPKDEYQTKENQPVPKETDWLSTTRWSGCPGRPTFEPFTLKMLVDAVLAPVVGSATFSVV